jgi:TolB-like protein/tetratricopeptide (TPR) repeat protein
MTGVTRTYWRRILASFAVYAAAGWAVVEALTTVVERFALPDWLGPLVVALYVAGLPVTVYLVWRTAGVERRLTWPSLTGAMSFLVVATAALFLLTRPVPQAEPTTVAVLPCAIKGDGGNANRAEGFAEDVHARLSRIESLKVISWNSSLFVRERGYETAEIAKVLQADRVVQCTMGGGDQRLAVSAQLIDPVGARVLWTRDYDFVATDIGTVVTEFVRTLLDVLASPAQAAEVDRINDIGTFSPEAYDLYLQARGSDDHDEVEALLDAALGIDPNFANALILRAQNAASQLIWKDEDYFDNLREALDILRQQAEKALSIDPNVFGARTLLATVCGSSRTYLGSDCSPDEERRLEWEECNLHGETAAGWACRHRLLAFDGAENDEALMRWLELEPTNASANLQYMSGLFIDRRAEEFIAALDTFTMLYPGDRRPSGLLSNGLRPLGRLDEVLAWRMAMNDDRMPEEPRGNVRLTLDFMNLGLFELAESRAMIVHEFRRVYMPDVVAMLLRLRGDGAAAAELIDWNITQMREGGVSPSLLGATGFYFDVLGDLETARKLYNEVLASRSLESLCEQADECIFLHALQLQRIAEHFANAEQAARWLQAAEGAFDRMLPYRQSDPVAKRTKAFEGMLLIAQGRHDEALVVLREAVFLFETPSWKFGDLDLPLYRLETNPIFDQVRERSEFRQLLDDYDAYLAPMRDRVLQAVENGNWEALRENTLRWLREEGE